MVNIQDFAPYKKPSIADRLATSSSYVGRRYRKYVTSVQRRATITTAQARNISKRAASAERHAANRLARSRYRTATPKALAEIRAVSGRARRRAVELGVDIERLGPRTGPAALGRVTDLGSQPAAAIHKYIEKRGTAATRLARAAEIKATRATARTAARATAFERSFAGRAARVGKGLWGAGKWTAGAAAGLTSAFSNPWVGGGLIAAGLVAGVAGGIFAGLSGQRPPRQSPAGYATQTMGAGYPTFFAASGPLSSNNLSTNGLTQALYNTRHKQH